jgi:hypothetical protein
MRWQQRISDHSYLRVSRWLELIYSLHGNDKTNTSYAWPPRVSRTIIVREVPTKSKSGLCSRDEVLAPSNAWSGRHPGLSHSPSNKPPLSREGWFDKVVTGLLGLSAPIKPDKWSVQIKACHRGQNNTVLNRHRWGLPPMNLRIVTTLSSSFPSGCSTIP